MRFIFAYGLIMAIIAIGVFGGSERTCEPGTIRDSICGPCKCNAYGSAEDCENNSCLEYHPKGQPIKQLTKRIVRAVSDRCTPGESFKMDCNMCVCTSAGRKSQALCTLIACPPSETYRPNRRNLSRYYPRW